MLPRQPDAVFGIDFGMECTKVAVSLQSSRKEYLQIEPICWSAEDKPQNALPTAVAYRDEVAIAIGHIPEAVLWELKAEVFEWFKLDFLSSTATNKKLVASHRGTSTKQAGQLTSDFLTGLRLLIANFYEATRSTMQPHLPAWDEALVDIILSVPSLAGSQGGENLVRVAREAGFQTENGRHRVYDIVLTEPEAGVLQALEERGESLENGDIVLALDVGGGTSDLSILAIADKMNGRLKTDFLQPVSSEELGGSYIDAAFQDIVTCHLEQLNGSFLGSDDAKVAAWRVRRHESYFDAKSSLCADEMVGQFRLKIPSLPKDLSISTLEEGGIYVKDRNMFVERTVLAGLFDEQILGGDKTGPGILGQIVNMREDLVVRTPSRSKDYRESLGLSPVRLDYVDHLNFFLFIGGLCGSQYLQEQVKKGVMAPVAATLKGLHLDDCNKDTKFRKVPDQQLCVCQGLVKAHLQALEIQKPAKVSPSSKLALLSFVRLPLPE